jgi:hypothetical protein
MKWNNILRQSWIKLLTLVDTFHPHWRYLHFEVVVGIARSNDPESYTGGSRATGRVSQAGQFKGDDPDKERYPGPPGWGWS